MSIDQFLERHKDLLAAAEKGATFSAATREQLQRPIEVQERRVVALKRRIETLETTKQAQVQRLDESIRALRVDLANLERKIATDRELLAPVLKGSQPPADPAGGDSTKERKP